LVSNLDTFWPKESETEPRLCFSGDLTLKIHGRVIRLNPSLSLQAGQAVRLSGPTGCGKTSFLTVLAGLTDYRILAGRLHFEPGSRPLAFVSQNPALQTLGADVWEETLAGALNYGRSRSLAEADAAYWLSRLNLGDKTHHSPDELSIGQRQRLVLASALTLAPGFLILDEPFSQLDSTGQTELIALLRELKQKGLAILIVDNENLDYLDLMDNYVSLYAQEEMDIPPEGLAEIGPATDDLKRPVRPVLEGHNLSLSWPPDFKTTVTIEDFRLKSGQRVAVVGPNGCGKSSFMAALTKTGPLCGGGIRWFGEDNLALKGLAGRVGFLPQNPERLFFNDTVKQEVAFALTRLNLSQPEVEARTGLWLARLGLANLADRRPRELSFGQKRLLGLATVLAPEPEVLILDEPFTGLDGRFRGYLKKKISNGWGDYRPVVVMLCHNNPEEDFGFDEIWRFSGHRLHTGQTWPAEVPPPPEGPRKNKTGLGFARAGQFRFGRSWLHRCPIAVKFFGLSLMATVALLGRWFWLTPLIIMLTLFFGCSAGLLRPLIRDLRVFCWPLAIMLLLYCFRFGFNLAALNDFLTIGTRLIAVCWPFTLFQRSTDPEALQKQLKRFFTARQSFLLAAGLKIGPLILREIPDILAWQRLRGAKLAFGKFWKKNHVSDWLTVFFLTLVFRIIDLAGEMSIIARLRGLEGYVAKPIHAEINPGDDSKPLNS
jgi:energy-coupling factor transport system ATP-binding protein